MERNLFNKNINVFMFQQLITNFYIHGISKRIFTNLRTIKNYSQDMYDKDKKEKWEKCGLLHGVIDGWRLNSTYKELIEILEISKIKNDENKIERIFTSLIILEWKKRIY